MFGVYCFDLSLFLCQTMQIRVTWRYIFCFGIMFIMTAKCLFKMNGSYAEDYSHFHCDLSNHIVESIFSPLF